MRRIGSLPNAQPGLGSPLCLRAGSARRRPVALVRGQPRDAHALARAIRRVLAGGNLTGRPSQRALSALEALRIDFAWVDDASSVVVRGPGSEARWWTFAGLRANAVLASGLGDMVASPQVRDNLAIPLRPGVDAEQLRRQLDTVDGAELPVSAVSQGLTQLEFGTCLPEPLANGCCGASDDAAGQEMSSARRARGAGLVGATFACRTGVRATMPTGVSLRLP
jgi:hypothetical protein